MLNNSVQCGIRYEIQALVIRDIEDLKEAIVLIAKQNWLDYMGLVGFIRFNWIFLGTGW